MIDVFEYYKIPGQLSSLGKYTDKVDSLTNDTRKLTEVVQGIILHDMWIGRYNVTPKSGQWCSALAPSMEDLLDTVVAIDKEEPFQHREPGERVIACCREFSTMLCGILRAKGIAARARCGFAPYLAQDGYFEDHWMCEVWDGSRWQRVDPQIDNFQLNTIKNYAKKHDNLGSEYRSTLLELNPLDLKPTDFLLAGDVWLKYRAGKIDPRKFGIDTDLRRYNIISPPFGEWFIRGNLIRDFLALNKIEILPFVEGLEKSKNYWANWRIVLPDAKVSESDTALFDMIAELSLYADNNLEEIQRLYKENELLHPPSGLAK
ncbi:transglutaminase domain-containing protein [Candidatus Nomurabacteria bacterium]|nr:transglutaminase domain-containing protein [Candidatus Nomurabacteria bacterium]